MADRRRIRISPRLYLDLRPGESNADRLARARTLAKLAPRDPESRMALASAAIAACDYATARETMLPLIQGDERPTVRMCLIMAELEEAEHGESGFARDWLARATRAPRDATWIAGGVMSDHWLPALPATGKLDAFVWRKTGRTHQRRRRGGRSDFQARFPARAEPPILIEKPRMAIAAPEPEKQAAPAPEAASPAQEEAHAEIPPGVENEPVASTTPPDPGQDKQPEPPQGLRQLY